MDGKNMTARELSKLHYLNELIKRDECRLSEMKEWMVEKAENTNPSAEALSQVMAKQKEEIRYRLVLHMAERFNIESFIYSVDDYQLQTILLLRFSDCLTWNQIAKRIGGNNTADGVRMYCNRFLHRKNK